MDSLEEGQKVSVSYQISSVTSLWKLRLKKTLQVLLHLDRE